ncbi:pseudouridine synthase [Azospirillum cavernae]
MSDTDLNAASSAEGGERIAKRLARAGLCSRRDAERWIAEGRVAVNNQTLATPACVVRPGDIVQVDGKVIPEPEPARLWRYYKPSGLVTSARDEKGRETVFDRLPPELPRVVSIGRLDLTTEGLLLLTNDGELARFLELPATGWTRRYRVRVFGEVDEIKLAALAKGPTIDGVKYGPIEAVLDRIQGRNAWLTVALKEGKNREIRKVMEAMGLVVNRLIRVAYGPFQLGKLEESGVEEVPKRIVREQIANYFTGDSVVGEGESNTKLRAKARAEASATVKAAPPPITETRSRSGARVEVARKSDTPQAAPLRAPRSATKRLEAQAAWTGDDAKPAARRADGKPSLGKPSFKPTFKRGEDAGDRPERPARGRTLSLDDANSGANPGAKPTRSGGKPEHRADHHHGAETRDSADARPRKPYGPKAESGKPEGGKPARPRFDGAKPDARADHRGSESRDTTDARPRKPYGPKTDGGKPEGGKPARTRFDGAKPDARADHRGSESRDATGARPRKPYGPKADGGKPEGGKPARPRFDGAKPDARADRPKSDRPKSAGPKAERSQSERPKSDRSQSDRPKSGGPRPERKEGGKPFAAKSAAPHSGAKPSPKPTAKPAEAGAPAGVKKRDGRTDRQRVERPRKDAANKAGPRKEGPGADRRR